MRQTDQLRIIPADREQHGEQVYDLLGKVFAGDEDYYCLANGSREVMGDPVNHYDWASSRVAFIGERLVGHFGVWDYRMRVGKSRLRVAGIGCVATHGDHRKRGIMARVVADALRGLRSAGYDLTILFAIPDFYHRYGYVAAWPDTTHEVDLGELVGGRSPGRLRRLDLARSDAAARLYNRSHAGLVATAVRPTYRRHYRGMTGAHCWHDDDDRLVGYVRAGSSGDDGELPILRCLEAVGNTDLVIGALANLGRRSGARRLRCEMMPTDHPLLVRLRRGNCRVETHHWRSSEAMVATVNLRRALVSLTGELEARLRVSSWSDWHGELLVADARDRVMLKIGDGRVVIADDGKATGGTGRRVRHAIRGREHLAQLLIGSEATMEVVEHGRIRLTGDARRLAGVLFPARQPSLAGWDRY